MYVRKLLKDAVALERLLGKPYTFACLCLENASSFICTEIEQVDNDMDPKWPGRESFYNQLK